jgi:excinuclease ABC subunit A
VKDRIIVRGARQHNLKGFDVEIPRRSYTVVTGPSGSGKSSLAFDTIYAEGQRRYVESLSAYARQFLERMEKPDVDAIEGLSPAVAIEQRNPTKTSRSTVGTATEVYDYLRLLWARVGRTFCPACGRELRPDTVEGVSDAVAALPDGHALQRSRSRSASRPRSRTTVVDENLRAQGFVRVAVDGEMLHLDDVGARGLDLTAAAELLVVVDRLAASAETAARLSDAMGTAFREGTATRRSCSPSPFRRPRGARRAGGGVGAPAQLHGAVRVPERRHPPPRPVAAALLVQQPARRLRDVQRLRRRARVRRALVVCDPSARSPPAPSTRGRSRATRPSGARWWSSRGASASRSTCRGATCRATSSTRILHATARGYVGAFPFLRSKEEKRYKAYIRVFLRQYQMAQTCRRAAAQAQARGAVRARGRRDDQPGERDARRRAQRLARRARADAVRAARGGAHPQGGARACASSWTWGSATCRCTGHAHAVRRRGAALGLANSLGSQLVDTLYVLDEPSVGLHSRDMQRLLGLLRRLRDAATRCSSSSTTPRRSRSPTT